MPSGLVSVTFVNLFAIPNRMFLLRAPLFVWRSVALLLAFATTSIAHASTFHNNILTFGKCLNNLGRVGHSFHQCFHHSSQRINFCFFYHFRGHGNLRCRIDRQKRCEDYSNLRDKYQYVGGSANTDHTIYSWTESVSGPGKLKCGSGPKMMTPELEFDHYKDWKCQKI